jgi:hypothetical protein
MRELTLNEIAEVSGGDGFVEAFALGGAVGGTGYGLLTLAAGYSLGSITAAVTAGAAIGGIAGAVGYGSYLMGTAAGLGEVGSWIGQQLAEDC